MDKRLCTFCGYGYDKGNDEGDSDEQEFCVLDCLGFFVIDSISVLVRLMRIFIMKME